MMDIGIISATMNGFKVLLVSCKSLTFVKSSIIGFHSKQRTEVKTKISAEAVRIKTFRYSLAWYASPLPSLFPIKVVEVVERTESIPKKYPSILETIT